MVLGFSGLIPGTSSYPSSAYTSQHSRQPMVLGLQVQPATIMTEMSAAGCLAVYWQGSCLQVGTRIFVDLFIYFIIPLCFIMMWNLRIGSMRASVCPGSDLRNYSMDFLDIWQDERALCPIVTKIKMADLCCFLCQNWTFLFRNHHSV